MGLRETERIFLQFERWGFDSRGYSARTRRNYGYRVRAAEAWARKHNKGSIVFAKTATIRDYLAATVPAARNRNHIRQSLLAFFDFLVESGLRQDNPVAAIKRLPTPRGIPKALTEADARAFLRAAAVFGRRARALVNLLAYQGLRITEALTLEWVQVEDEPGYVRFAAKGGKPRLMPLHERAAEALRAWRVECPDARYVFPSPFKDGPLSYTWARDLLKDIGRMAGVEAIHPHLWRHTYATTLLERGVNLREVQEALGHASLETTAIYLKVRPVKFGRSLSKLDYEERENMDLLAGEAE